MRITNTRQLVDRALEQVANLAACGSSLRMELHKTRHGDDLPLRVPKAFDRLQRDMNVLSLTAADRLVDHDTSQPHGEACIRTELSEVRERAQIGILHHVLSLSVIADDGACDAIEPLIVTPDDQAQRGRTSLSRETHEFGVDEPRQLQLRSGLLRHAH